MKNLNAILPMQQVKSLLAASPISENIPWSLGDEALIDAFFRNVCAKVSSGTGTVERGEWQNYGSGYATFIDAWFYQPNEVISVKQPKGNQHRSNGLVVLLSRLSHYFVLMEGEKSWNDWGGGSSYLPAFKMVDQFSTSTIAALANNVQPILEGEGLIRLSSEELCELLPPELRVPTILSDGPFRKFDALFYWED